MKYCATDKPEIVHDWKLFTTGFSSVWIVIDRRRLSFLVFAMGTLKFLRNKVNFWLSIYSLYNL